MTSKEILEKYWQFDSFRNPQEEIINSVLNGNDTVALMPTGGGKSLCFQVPAMMSDGLCLVISPLIALMKDQVANLKLKNIKAMALIGGIGFEETNELLDNCAFGNYKFLYLSPERLQIDWIYEKIITLKINLIAIDEAHCVSQWGHDFRPAYLQISKLKENLKNTPFLALTASATKRVLNDIIEQLHFEKPSIFQKSYNRENIAYMVFETEDKFNKLIKILQKNPQSSIIYVRNRLACSDTAKQLIDSGFTATYYHGGLNHKEKDTNMQLWMTNKAQVIVATNAFGMGIDKPDVKTVIHTQLPENIENYYQESGRAGRNGAKAFAVILLNPEDIVNSEYRFLESLPDKGFLKEVYLKLNNYFRIAYGEGIETPFAFDLSQFCTKYNFPILKTYNVLTFLDRQSIITLSKQFSKKIYIQFLISSKEVMRYMSLNPEDENIILSILRNYAGVYDNLLPINTGLIAKKSGETEPKTISVIERLFEKKIIIYQAKNNDSTILFNEIRQDDYTINRISKSLTIQNDLKKTHFLSVKNYLTNTNSCKRNLILNYFDQEAIQDCGICSTCLQKKIKNLPLTELSNQIIGLLKINEMSSRELEHITKCNTKNLLLTLQNMLDNNMIKALENNKFTLKNDK